MRAAARQLAACSRCPQGTLAPLPPPHPASPGRRSGALLRGHSPARGGFRSCWERGLMWPNPTFVGGSIPLEGACPLPPARRDCHAVLRAIGQRDRQHVTMSLWGGASLSQGQCGGAVAGDRRAMPGAEPAGWGWGKVEHWAPRCPGPNNRRPCPHVGRTAVCRLAKELRGRTERTGSSGPRTGTEHHGAGADPGQGSLAPRPSPSPCARRCSPARPPAGASWPPRCRAGL